MSAFPGYGRPPIVQAPALMRPLFCFALLLAAFAMAPTGNVAASNCPTITLSPTTLGAPTVGAAYSQTLTASGGTGPYSWTLVTGTLPAGLSLSTSGVVSGTPTSSNGAGTSVVVKATDSQLCSATLAYSLKVCPTITIGPSTLPTTTLNAAYSQTLSASGGMAPYLWSLASGTLPNGLTLKNYGVISGTPTSSTPATFTVKATDGNGCAISTSYTLTAGICPSITVAPASIPSATLSTAYSQTISVSGGAAPYVFTVNSGALPAWASLDSATGIISGIPDAVSTATFAIAVTDANGCVAFSPAYTLVSAVCPTITLSPTTLTAPAAGGAYSQALTATGGSGPYSWTLVSGTLPAGLSLSSAGVISGTPASANGAGVSVVIKATDSQLCTATVAYNLKVCPTITVGPPTLPTTTVGTAYSQALSASGGTGPYSWTLMSGALPAGLSLSTAGLISGTPSSPTAATFTVKAVDVNGCAGPLSSFTITAGTCPSITVAPPTLPSAVLNVPYSQAIAVTGGAAPYSFMVVGGALPAWAALDVTTGVISGTPVTASTATFVIGVSDTNGCLASSPSYTLAAAVCPTLVISPTTLGASPMGAAYSQALTASGGTGPVTWTLLSGTLPAGLTLSSAGVISGTSTAANGAGTAFTVRATDSALCSATITYSLKVCPTISIGPGTLPSGTVNTAYSQALTASGGPAPYLWSLVSGALPAGLSLSNAGVISGTPTSPASATFSVAAIDVNGCSSVPSSFTLTPAAGATFAQWQAQQKPGSLVGANDSPNGDVYDNLISFALSLDGSGVRSSAPFKVYYNSTTGTFDATLVRLAGGHPDLVYSLQGSTSNSASAVWTTLAVIPSVAANANGTETLTYADIASQPVFAGATTGYVRLKIDLDADLNGTPENTSLSPVYAFSSLALPLTLTTFSMPLLQDEIFYGRAVSATSGSIEASSAGIKEAMAAGRSYYVEVQDGTHEGERYEVDEAGTAGSTIAVEAGVTVPSDIAGARIIVRPHWALNDVLPASGFHAGYSPASADGVMFYEGGGYSVIWVLAAPGGPRWVAAGDASMQNIGSTRLIAPTKGLLTQIRATTVTVHLAGLVCTCACAVALDAGPQLVGGGWPVQQSLTGRGMTIANGFARNDSVLQWAGDSAPGTTGFVRFSMASPDTWLKAGDATLVAVNNLPLFTPFHAAFISPARSITGWKQPPP